MSNANLGEPTSPVNDKTPQSAEINNPPVPVPSVPPVDFSQFMTRQDMVKVLRAMIDGATDHLAAEKIPVKPPIVVPAAVHSPEKTLRKNSRKDMQEQREIFAMVALTRMGGIPDVHAVAEVMARQFGSFHFASLYRYERFMGLYKMLRKQAIAAARDGLNKGFKTGGGGLEAIQEEDEE